MHVSTSCLRVLVAASSIVPSWRVRSSPVVARWANNRVLDADTIQEALKADEYHMGRAAKSLGMSRQKLDHELRQSGLVHLVVNRGASIKTYPDEEMFAALRAAAETEKGRPTHRFHRSAYMLFQREYFARKKAEQPDEKQPDEKRTQSAAWQQLRTMSRECAAAWWALSTDEREAFKGRYEEWRTTIQNDEALNDFGRFKKPPRADEEPPGTLYLATAAYRRQKERNPDWPGVATILVRFGTWNDACLAAGIQPAGARRPQLGTGKGFGAQRYTDEQCIAFMAAFVAHADEVGIKSTVRAYQEWATQEPGRVREGALRRRMLAPRGRWSSWGSMVADIREGKH